MGRVTNHADSTDRHRPSAVVVHALHNKSTYTSADAFANTSTHTSPHTAADAKSDAKSDSQTDSQTDAQSDAESHTCAYACADTTTNAVSDTNSADAVTNTKISGDSSSNDKISGDSGSNAEISDNSGPDADNFCSDEPTHAVFVATVANNVAARARADVCSTTNNTVADSAAADRSHAAVCSQPHNGSRRQC
jgi:hypothetical protein